MILTAQVRPEKRNVIPSVTHVDGSARPQTVEREINPLYYRLIDEFGKITGVPVIMNTSFNLRGEGWGELPRWLSAEGITIYQSVPSDPA